ncbi:MAG TPA: LamG-like jellyroll fold domain-containing protein [Puia sp.]|nr:LamG-like jellyroll fold domain-containing protein [Puia sp.]
MKGNYIWRKLIGAFSCFLLALAGNGQSTLCHSSFSITTASPGVIAVSQSSVVINPVPPGAFSQLYNTGGFTWEAWFRLKAPVMSGGIIVSVEDPTPFQDIVLGFGWGSIPNALSFHVSDNGANNTVITAESLQTYTLNTWYHVAAVCDYAGANGSDIDIDEVRFWNTARTTTEIQNSMTQCLTLPQAGLVAWFKADEAGADGSYIWYCEYSKRGSTQPGKLKGVILLIR